MAHGVVISICFVLSSLLSASVSQECDEVLTGPLGEVQSPGYPDSYPPNTRCHWLIQAPPTRKIILNLNDFNLEDSADCFSGDYLTVTDPKGESNMFCGQEHPQSIESVGNVLYVDFW
ncbi:unnamed protein product [Darwinula stevensoni]|uniref:CUB domain-containing protein n=1 Tax=Darwinula stevensoni TaxID=69355 RepID=A0A7R8XDY8_9CRUS|nr:unnamed protein product [Darwinula stevensoni]CAG0894795.1 unnamed protein product [Darwinula stevensoni]